MLTSVASTGSTNGTTTTQSADTNTVSLVGVVTLPGSQATTNRLGNWIAEGNTLVAADCRGGVEYNFSVPAADVYHLQVEGTQNLVNSSLSNFDLTLSVDGLDLGHFLLTACYGTNGIVECWTPYLLTGQHTVRVFWDGAASFTELQLNAIRVQAGTGADSNGDGIKDWVASRVDSQSGLDQTNNDLTSYTSPFAILFGGEGSISVINECCCIRCGCQYTKLEAAASS